MADAYPELIGMTEVAHPAGVNILVSTYNGGPFLNQQMDSLLAQTYPSFKITVRDDGSDDGTYERLLEYAGEHQNVFVIRGRNLGVSGCFFELLSKADDQCDFYAFSDQDDVWLPHKIQDAVDAMMRHDLSYPLMYFSRLELVDSELRHISYTPIVRRPHFANALVESNAYGCTIVLNKAARAAILDQHPNGKPDHDWWSYLVVSHLGSVIYDEKPNIKHRLHTRNTAGCYISWKDQVLDRLIAFRSRNCRSSRYSVQATEFYRCYGDRLEPYRRKSLEDFIGCKEERIGRRIKYAYRTNVFLQNKWATLWFRVKIVLGNY